MNENEMETMALKLTGLLKSLSGVDTDNAQALAEMPIAISVAAELSDALYCLILDKEV